MHESRRDTMWEEEGDNWGKKDDKKGKVWVNMIKVHYIHM
jgi:hypothetical protein